MNKKIFIGAMEAGIVAVGCYCCIYYAYQSHLPGIVRCIINILAFVVLFVAYTYTWTLALEEERSKRKSKQSV